MTCLRTSKSDQYVAMSFHLVATGRPASSPLGALENAARAGDHLDCPSPYICKPD
jgi:hypothetical protein